MVGLKWTFASSTNARNQGAARAAAQRPTAPRAGAFATCQAFENGQGHLQAKFTTALS
jgi:hypothetical protein